MKQFIERIDARVKENKEFAKIGEMRNGGYLRMVLDYTVKAACECVSYSERYSKKEEIAVVKKMIEELCEEADKEYIADPTMKRYIKRDEAQYLYNDFCLYFKLDA